MESKELKGLAKSFKKYWNIIFNNSYLVFSRIKPFLCDKPFFFILLWL